MDHRKRRYEKNSSVKTFCYNDRRISICIHDFEECNEVPFLRKKGFSVDLKKRGDKTGKEGVIKKNSLEVSQSLSADDVLDDSLEKFLKALGAPTISRMIKKLRPKSAWIELDIPAKNSPRQESVYLSPGNIKILGQLGLGLAVEIFEFDKTNKTH